MSLSRTAKLVLKDYHARSQRAVRYLNDSMLQAILADCIMSTMIARYEVEEERDKPTNPNEYVRLYWELSKLLFNTAVVDEQG